MRWRQSLRSARCEGRGCGGSEAGPFSGSEAWRPADATWRWSRRREAEGGRRSSRERQGCVRQRAWGRGEVRRNDGGRTGWVVKESADSKGGKDAEKGLLGARWGGPCAVACLHPASLDQTSAANTASTGPTLYPRPSPEAAGYGYGYGRGHGYCHRIPRFPRAALGASAARVCWRRGTYCSHAVDTHVPHRQRHTHTPTHPHPARYLQNSPRPKPAALREKAAPGDSTRPRPSGKAPDDPAHTSPMAAVAQHRTQTAMSTLYGTHWRAGYPLAR